MDRSIMPECFADTLLMEILVPTKIGYGHRYGCFNIEAEMKFGELKDRFAVGIIDNDKNKIAYLKEFESIDDVEGALILWRHKNEQKHHYIIQICPALEKWILRICAEEKIKVEEFGFENDLEALKKYSKSKKKIEDKKLTGLFKMICSKEQNISIRKLKNWITILRERNYHVDLNDLKNG